MLYEVEQDALRANKNVSNIRMVIPNKRGDIGRYCQTSATNEIAAIFETSDGTPPLKEDIQVYSHGEGIKKISVKHCMLDAMTYPLLFPEGKGGFQRDIPHLDLQEAHVTR